MKGVDVVAIDKNYGQGAIGLDAKLVESIGDFELVDPPEHTAHPYITRRTMTVVFGGLKGLVIRLEKFYEDGKGFSADGFEGFFETGSIDNLVLITHGSPGRIDINGLGRPVLEADDLLTGPVENGMPDDPDLAFPAKIFQRLGNFLAPNATVRIDGCNIANGTNGTELLQALSRKWPGRKIVGFVDFAAISYSESHHRVATVVDSEELYPNHPGKFAMKWETLTHAARSATSPFAKVAQDGSIIQWPPSEVFKPGLTEELILNFTDNPLKHPFTSGF